MRSLLFSALLLLCAGAKAQTGDDAIMMHKYQWCSGLSYDRSQWKNYWEGTLKRDNENIGTFTSQSAVFMTNYGISSKLNVLAGLPYVWNHVSGGTLHKMSGFQDASLMLKYKPLALAFGKSRLGVYVIGGINTPVNNYVVDFLPLAIGMGTTNVMGKALVDYQYKKFSLTASAAYTLRGNTSTDRSAYYTDHMVYSHDIEMPNVASYMVRAGYRSQYLIAEAIGSNMTTLGGFDIRRNDMPFPSNRMNATSIGAHVKYTLPFYKHVELTADGMQVLKGRNVGQATAFSAGVYYIFFASRKKDPHHDHSKCTTECALH